MVNFQYANYTRQKKKKNQRYFLWVPLQEHAFVIAKHISLGKTNTHIKLNQTKPNQNNKQTNQPTTE